MSVRYSACTLRSSGQKIAKMQGVQPSPTVHSRTVLGRSDPSRTQDRWKKSAWAQLRRDRPSPSRTVPRCHRIQSRNQFCASVIIQHISILRLRNSLPKTYLFVKLSTRNTLMGWLLGESLSGFVMGAVGYCGWRRSGVGGGASRAERTKLGWAKARQADQQGLGLSGAEPRRAGFG